MIVNHDIVSPKIATKMNDCWYACIQMIKSATMGVKTKPAGATTLSHRNITPFGRGLSFATTVGVQVMAENKLEDVSEKVKLDRILTLAEVLETRGPVIACGKFGFFNTAGHCIVISGCNTDTGLVAVYDPAWAHGRADKSWNYITRYCWKMMGDEDSPASGTFIANETNLCMRPFPER